MSERYKQKVLDAIGEIEVAMQRLRGEIEKGEYTFEACNIIIKTQKSVQKLGTYLFKLPNTEMREIVRSAKKRK